jgi:hypothetical protein
MVVHLALTQGAEIRFFSELSYKNIYIKDNIMETRVYQLRPGDTFVIAGTDKEFLNEALKRYSNDSLFRIIKKEYWERPWYKFFMPKVLKRLIIMYLGESC